MVFPADEFGNAIGSVDAFIPVVDDDINERLDQVFIVLLEVVDAIKPVLVNNALATCVIFDNDRRLNNLLILGIVLSFIKNVECCRIINKVVLPMCSIVLV